MRLTTVAHIPDVTVITPVFSEKNMQAQVVQGQATVLCSSAAITAKLAASHLAVCHHLVDPLRMKVF